MASSYYAQFTLIWADGWLKDLISFSLILSSLFMFISPKAYFQNVIINPLIQNYRDVGECLYTYLYL